MSFERVLQLSPKWLHRHLRAQKRSMLKAGYSEAWIDDYARENSPRFNGERTVAVIPTPVPSKRKDRTTLLILVKMDAAKYFELRELFADVDDTAIVNALADSFLDQFARFR